MSVHPQRNLQIFQLHQSGHSFRRIADTFGISSSRAQQIFKRMKTLEEEKARGTLRGLGLTGSSIRAIASHTGVENPTLVDLVKLVQECKAEALRRLREDHEITWAWDVVFLQKPYCGRKVLREVTDALKQAEIAI